MPRRESPEEWYLARRIGLADRLESEDMLPDLAEWWVMAWEAEAHARRIDPKTPAFWDGAGEWIAEQSGR